MDEQQLEYTFHITSLLTKKAQGDQLSIEEERVLAGWLSEQSIRKHFVDNAINPEIVGKDIVRMGLLTDSDVQLEMFRTRLAQKKRMIVFRRWVAAAAIFLAFGFGMWAVWLQLATETSPVKLTSRYGEDVRPATNGPILQLDDGSVINLDNKAEGIVSQSGDITYVDGEYVQNISADVKWVTLSIPNGSNYRVTLSDSSVVTLNAGSSLRYPTRFDSQERKVELKGEAFFDVKHIPSQKFVVETMRQRISVLGTEFNVRAYTQQEATSLIKGKVAVRSHEKDIFLSPGDQAVVDNTSLNKRTVDVEETISWLDGRIAGSLVGLQEVSPDIERRYDVHFVYPSDYQARERAYINIDATENLSVVLQALEQTYKVQFKIKGKEVFVF
ncbi:FecR family protein [Sphingobacterium faecale]|uniref:FecR domain-containing protein n=1 Tax=Sphingobacterium faecale TaxID=2803775 RepID=A0ABS1R6V0_9SPHI|nr:FecR domain-containing protein [Sphingobacterium faecale]MBL1410431.1 FecR domain-containing protein [Sphingobacterium faecale]